jgi:hypothetical protein
MRVAKGANAMARDTVKRRTAIMREGIGRPAVERRVAVGFRISPTLRKWLEAAASKSARSLSQEAEHRLEMTFEADGIVREALKLAYGPAVAKAMFQYADTMRTMQIVRDLTERGAMSDDNAQLIFATCQKHIRDLIAADPGKLEEVK